MLEKEVIEKLIQKVGETHDLELNQLLKLLLEEREELIDEAATYREKANIDNLTGVHNRNVLSHLIDCSSLAICDIDNFKSINDTYGHTEGDRVIRGVAKIIRQSVRDQDIVCRYGGDEFVIGFRGCFQEEVIRNRLEQIVKEIADEIVLGKEMKPVGLSVGMVMNYQQEEIKDLIPKADQALYQSKESGKGRVSQYGEKIEEEKSYS